MRMVSKALLVLGLVALMAGPALAQRQQRGQGRGGFGGRAGGGNLLANKGVQEELKLSQDQIKKAEEVGQEVRSKFQDEFAKLRDLAPEEQREKGGEIMRKMREETQKALADVLKPEQQARLKQIERQNMGVQAFQDAEVQKALKLTADQQDKIKTIAEDAAKEMRAAFQGGPGGDIQERVKKFAEMRKENLAKVNAILTAEQKDQWKELTCKPFEVRMELGPQRRERQGGGQ